MRWDVRMSGWQADCIENYLGHTAAVRHVGFSPDNKFASTGCEDGSLRIWRVGGLPEPCV